MKYEEEDEEEEERWKQTANLYRAVYLYICADIQLGEHPFAA